MKDAIEIVPIAIKNSTKVYLFMICDEKTHGNNNTEFILLMNDFDFSYEK